MSDQYLWDRSGEPDPEVAALERLLRPLAHDGRPFATPSRARAAAAPAWKTTAAWLPLAASVALLVGGLAGAPREATPAVWRVAAAAGEPRVDGRGHAPGAALAAGAVMTPGATVSTDGASRVRLELAGVGRVEVGPGSAIRVDRARPGSVRLTLAAGTLRADITAPPGVFVVDTPASRAVDLGCQYTLDTDAQGRGRLHVTLGWVALAWRGRESLVPAGALCATRAANGPGTPYFEGATPAFVEAVAALDSQTGPGPVREGALRTLLADARPLDAITLWHFFGRLDRVEVERIYERLAALAPPPDGVTLARVQAGDATALAAWWERLGLGDLEELRAGLRAAAR